MGREGGTMRSRDKERRLLRRSGDRAPVTAEVLAMAPSEGGVELLIA